MSKNIRIVETPVEAEPVYNFVKGQGWVPQLPEGKYYVMYRSPDGGTWRNANRKGSCYSTYQSALYRATDGGNPKYEYKIVTEEDDYVEW